MTTILDTIAAHAQERAERAQEVIPAEQMARAAEAKAAQELAQAGSFPFRFRRNLAAPGMSFICEAKKASPSKGIIAEEFPYLDIARSYEAAGAAAISCLTEPKWFLGHDNFLRDIATTVDVPVLRKDFVTCQYMVDQAKVLGAEAVLLICSILSDEQLASYLARAHELGMDALVEAHDEEEIARAVAAGAKIVGVNNRNLKDFSVDFGNAQRLRACIPEGVLYVAESGVKTAEDVAAIARMGADAALVGEALMRAEDRAGLLAAFKKAAAEAVA